jgi:hypothetical protein
MKTVLQVLETAESIHAAAKELGMKDHDLTLLCDTKELWEARERCRKRGIALRTQKARDGRYGVR